MPFFQQGDIRIRYEEVGSGFPLLVTPGGGLNSRVSNWPTAVITEMSLHVLAYNLKRAVAVLGAPTLIAAMRA